MEKLKLCPFCGHYPELFELGTEMNGWIEDAYYKCTNEYCATRPETRIHNCEWTASIAWNTRAEDSCQNQ